MNTSKPISTISYNSEIFLVSVLKSLHSLHIISDYMYIVHQPEDDEKKVHIHLYLKPNTKVDTIELQERFKELDPNHPKPLGCIDFESSKIDDWILYNQHFRPYLLSKLEDRKFYYQESDFRFLDQDTFNYNYLHAFKQSDWAKDTQIRTLLNNGQMSGCDLVLSGVVPLQMSTSLLALANLERMATTERGGRANHEDNEFNY